MKLTVKACGAVALLLTLAGCGGGADAPRSAATMSNTAALPDSGWVAADYKPVVQQLYIAYFGRPADASGLANFSAQLAALSAPNDIQGLVASYGTQPAMRALIDSFGVSPESNALYSGDTTVFVTSIYRNVLNRAPDAEGLAFWVNAIDRGGLSKGNASLSIMAGALVNGTTQGQVDARIVSNKVSVATQFSAALNTDSRIASYRGDAAAATARAMLSIVNATTDANAYQAYINATFDTLAAITATGMPALSFLPSKLVQTYGAGESVSLSVRATLNRPEDFVSADTVYAYIVDNVGVITPSLSLIDNGNASYTATFYSSPTIPAGQYKGNLALKLCRDSACASHFPGSPVALPYEISVVAPAAAKLSASSTQSLSRTMHAGGAAPSAVPVTVSAPGLSWAAAADASWIALSNASGTGVGSFSIGYNGSGLTPGQYQGTVTVSTADGQKVALQVSLTVLETAFQFGSNSISFSAVNGAPIATQSLAFTLDSNASASWAVSSDAAWLGATPASGTMPGNVKVSVDAAAGSLASGIYTGNLRFTSPNINPKTLAVNLSLTKATLSSSMQALSFGGASGRSFDSSVMAMNLNTGSNAWPWSLSGVPAWLSSSQSSGLVSQAGTNVSFTPAMQNTPVGTTTVSMTASAKVNGDTVALPIAATIHKDQHRLIASENGVALVSTPNWSSVSRTVSLSDNFSRSTSWTASSDKPWLTVTPNGTTGASGSTLTLSASPAALATDTVHYATVTISATNAATVSAPETIMVALWKGSATPAAGTMVTLNENYVKLAMDPVRPYVYAHRGGGAIDVYHIYTAAKIGSFSSIGSALGDMTISSNGDYLYALDKATKNIRVVDLKSWSTTPVASWTLDAAVSEWTTVKAIRPNGVTVILVGDGTAYHGLTGERLGNTGIYGAMTATANGKRVYAQDEGYSPASVTAYSVDYSEMLGGVLQVSRLRSGSYINSSSNGRDIAVSADGTRLYTATGAPYRCGVVSPADLSGIGLLPGGDSYPNAVEIGVDGRVYCGISGWYSAADVWVHNAAGVQTGSFKFAGYARALLDRQMAISGDGMMMVALTDDPRLVFVAVGP